MNIIKFPKIKYLGSKENSGILDFTIDRIIYTEKIDGSNFRFWFEDEQLHFGSRNKELITEEDKKPYKKCIEYVINKFEPYIIEGKPGLEFFGEACFKHTINYNWNELPPFIGYSVYDTNNKKFLSWEETKMIYKEFGIMTVPEIKTDDNFIIPQSEFYDGKSEGFVIYSYEKQMFAKVVANEFKEENRKSFGKKRSEINNDDEIIIFKYCTNARINKAINKLNDEGIKIDITIMKNLYTSVWNDIIEERYKDILISNYKLDIKNIRRLISKRCLEVLKTYMINTQL